MVICDRLPKDCSRPALTAPNAGPNDRNRCTRDPLRSPLSKVWYMLIAVLDLRKAARRLPEQPSNAQESERRVFNSKQSIRPITVSPEK